MKEVLNKFGKLMENNYNFPKINIINGFGDAFCDKCGGLEIQVAVNPQYKSALEQIPMPNEFMGYPVKIYYTEPSIAF